MKNDINTHIMAMLHARTKGLAKGDPISPPIVSSAKYFLPGDPDHSNVYGRDTNETIQAVEAALDALEDAKTVAFPTGMAAITAGLMSCAKAGDRILLPSDGYFVTRALLFDALGAFDLNVDMMPTPSYDTADMSGYDIVWAETPSNPRLDNCDIAGLAARVKASGGTLIVDNTTLTPLLQRPLDLGADMVVASDTKAMSGHSDILFGHIATRRDDLVSKAKQWRKLSGAMPGPWEAFLLHRGLMTLEVRMTRMCQNAEALLTLFERHNRVQTVRYPGLGFVMGLNFDNADTAERFINDCPAIFPSTSFGGVHTSAERRARWGDDVPESYVRLSVGCEPEAALTSAISTILDQL